jgi:hypothetical protein
LTAGRSGDVQQLREVAGHEVGDPDCPHLAVGQKVLERFVGDGAVERGGQRLVQDQQVDLVHPELAGALVESVQGLVVPVVAVPDLGLDEDLGPADAGAADGLAGLPFVGVGGCGVDELPHPVDASPAGPPIWSG